MVALPPAMPAATTTTTNVSTTTGSSKNDVRAVRCVSGRGCATAAVGTGVAACRTTVVVGGGVRRRVVVGLGSGVVTGFLGRATTGAGTNAADFVVGVGGAVVGGAVVGGAVVGGGPGRCRDRDAGRAWLHAPGGRPRWTLRGDRHGTPSQQGNQHDRRHVSHAKAHQPPALRRRNPLPHCHSRTGRHHDRGCRDSVPPVGERRYSNGRNHDHRGDLRRRPIRIKTCRKSRFRGSRSRRTWS
jgi:hypothetical protein